MKYNELTFIKNRLAQATQFAFRSPASVTAVVLAGILTCAPVAAQQVGGIRGKVTAEQSTSSVSGVTVVATSPVMPKPRTVETRADGSFNLPSLVPGRYTLTITAADGAVKTMEVEVLLDQLSTVNVALSSSSGVEVIQIVGSPFFAQVGNSSLSNTLGADVVEALPVGQTFRDLLKVIPGVQYTENGTLGPSAGGSGAHNKYGFDGVDVSMPLFGNLASEPSTHDIEMVSMERGGAKAIGFNRSGGFAINTQSKSGTNEFKGSLEYKLQNSNFSASPEAGTIQDTDRSWITASLAGPIVQDQLFFYGSYYRPEVTGDSKVTAYGPAKNFKSVRDEYFGKLTWAPTADWLLNASYRDSDREGSGESIGEFESDSVSAGSQATQKIFTFDGSYILGDYTTVSFNINKFDYKTGGKPDVELAVVPELGGNLDVANLDQMGYFNVPDLLPATDPDAARFNSGAQQLIDQYGYQENGVATGGGAVGAYYQYNNQNFFRDSFEIALDHQIIGDELVHSIHIGLKYSEAEEELSRLSNGWGLISYNGGRDLALESAVADLDPTSVYYIATTEQMSFVNETGETVSAINSSSESWNLEINDTIEHGDFTYNIGVLISQDTYFGQGLSPNSANGSGWELARGEKYQMYKVDWQDMIQPRLGVNWKYDGQNTVFANFASYNPEASSLARAASWDRNTQQSLRVYFDEDGNFLDAGAASGSSGKLFADNMDPHRIDEITIGTTKAITDRFQLRGHTRYREGKNFWEDMPNNGRIAAYPDSSQAAGVPAHIAAKGLFIPDLAERMDGIGNASGGTYVIAEVDEGKTEYWEVSVEAEYFGDRTYFNASYVWSQYTGNFDQDNTTGNTDQNIFIGSSNYGDGPGRYSWDLKQGKLAGDKPHLLKAFGYYTTDWNANIGAYFVYQSGQPWETWDGSYYGYSSSTIRYSEPAGSRRSASHWQLDLSYTQNFTFAEKYLLKFRADIFNVFDRQTGYRIQQVASSTTYGEPTRYYNPRRIQLSVGIDF
ncbi:MULTISPECIES: TonB-dependent receptor [unclassified Arsukibacterium]|uniref:TonB-dependent receptor n=1 Tax=unclassified Arsukibacterium TaxID=2635278 RepID=UPI000C5BF941|nr:MULTISPECIES: carboxypeptidase regulatory-like domain-containing protein [unclassified Arsukibacterium]MAA94331.1 TonB-dependent receptor [Rheinheimera sp.]MBM34918.1 TonB-dependent receptor [Rheinheimera sp.]|tara:strand:+ start:58351 stop:61383 length:3033 start_codon:yes stop_codon:yes gene_type:complete